MLGPLASWWTGLPPFLGRLPELVSGQLSLNLELNSCNTGAILRSLYILTVGIFMVTMLLCMQEAENAGPTGRLVERIATFFAETAGASFRAASTSSNATAQAYAGIAPGDVMLYV
jgi:hypothetical protein